jgi:hypothetical protein
MSEAFSAGASYVASAIAQQGTATYIVAYVATYAIEVYALNKLTASLGASKPKGEGRGLEVSITDTGAAGFAIYGTVRVSGTNVVPDV